MAGDNIKVAIRVRKLIEKELSSGLKSHWLVDDDCISCSDVDVSGRKGTPYKFDIVFDEATQTIDIFEEVCKPIVDSALNGFNGTIFAYGQSSSGKTFTMSGSRTCPGVISLAVQEIFSSITAIPDREFLIRVGYIEIYNERVSDLLSQEEVNLKLHEDADRNIQVVGLTEEIVTDSQGVYAVLKGGNAKRHTAETKQNDRSSRSHCILRFVIESRAVGHEDDAVMVSNLYFVDLAGSEKAGDNSGERFREGCAINRSLFVLGNVIRKLSGDSNLQHVSYRDSKLTRILQNALGGNSKTAIICTITPAHVEESDSTLKFASRAKSITNKPTVNEVMSDGAMLKKYRRQIKVLEDQIKEFKDVGVNLEKAELEKRLHEKEEYQRQQSEMISKLQTMIVLSGPTTTNKSPMRKMRRNTWCPGKIQAMSHEFSKSNLLAPMKATLPVSVSPSNTMICEEEDEDIFSQSDTALHGQLDQTTGSSDSTKMDDTINTNPHVKELFQLQDKQEELKQQLNSKDQELLIKNQELYIKEQLLQKKERELRGKELALKNMRNELDELREEKEFEDLEKTCYQETNTQLLQKVADLEASQTSIPWLEEELMKAQQERNTLRQKVDSVHKQLNVAQDGTGLTQVSKQLDSSEAKVAELNSELDIQKSKYEFHIEQMRKKVEMLTAMLDEKGIELKKFREEFEEPKSVSETENSRQKEERTPEVGITCSNIDEGDQEEKDKESVESYKQALEELRQEYEQVKMVSNKVVETCTKECQTDNLKQKKVTFSVDEEGEKDQKMMTKRVTEEEVSYIAELEESYNASDEKRLEFEVSSSETGKRKHDENDCGDLGNNLKRSRSSDPYWDSINDEDNEQFDELDNSHMMDIGSELLKVEISDLKNKHKEELAELEVKISQYEDLLQQYNDTMDSIEGAVYEKISKVEHEHMKKTYQDEIQALKDEITIYTDLLKEDKHRLESVTSDTIETNAQDMEEISRLKIENEKLVSLLESEQRDAKVTETCQNVVAMEADTSEVESRIEELRKTHESEIEQMKEQFQKFAEEHFQNEKEIRREYEEEIEHLKHQSETVNENFKHQSETLNGSFKHQSETVNESLKHQSGTLNESLKHQSETLNESLKHQSGTLNESLKHQSETLNESWKHQSETVNERLKHQSEETLNKGKMDIEKRHKEQQTNDSISDGLEIETGEMEAMKSKYEEEIERLKDELEIHMQLAIELQEKSCTKESVALNSETIREGNAEEDARCTVDELETQLNEQKTNHAIEVEFLMSQIDELKTKHAVDIELLKAPVSNDDDDERVSRDHENELSNDAQQKLMERIKELEARENEQAKQIEWYESTTKELHTEMMTIRGQLETLSADIASLQSANSMLKREKLALLNTRDHLQHQLDQLQHQLVLPDEEHEMNTVENTTVGQQAKQTHDHLSEQLCKANEQIHETRKQLQETTEQLHETKQKYNDVSEQLHEKTGQLHEVNEQLHEAKQNYDDMSEQLHEKTEKLHEAKQKYDDISEKLHETSNEVNKELYKTTDETKKLLYETTEQLQEAKQKIDDISEQLNEKTQQLQEANEQLHEAKQKHDDVSEQLHEVKQKYDEVSEQLPETSNETNKELHETNNETTEQVLQTTEQLHEAKQRYDEISEQLNEKTEQLHEAKQSYDDISEQLNEKTEQLHEAKQSYDEISEQLNEKTEQLHEAKQTNDDISEQLHKANKQLHEKTEQLNKTTEELHETKKRHDDIAEQLHETTAQLHEITEQLHDAKQRYDDILGQLPETNNETDKQLQEKTVQLHETTEQLHEAKQRYDEISEQLHGMTEQLHEAKQTHDNMSEQLNEKTEQLHEAKQENDDVSEQLHKANIQLQEKTEQLNETTVQLHETKQRFDDMSELVHETNNETSKELQEMNTEMNKQLQEMNSEMTEQLHETNKQLQEMTEQLHEAKQNYEEISQQLHETTEQLHEAKQTCDDTSEQLHKANEQLQKTNKQLQEANEQLHEANKKQIDYLEQLRMSKDMDSLDEVQKEKAREMEVFSRQLRNEIERSVDLAAQLERSKANELTLSEQLNEITEKEMYLSQLLKEAKEKQNDLDSLLKQSNEKIAELNRRVISLEANTDICTEYEEKIVTLESELKDVELMYKQKIVDLEDNIKDSNHEIQRLSSAEKDSESCTGHSHMNDGVLEKQIAELRDRLDIVDDEKKKLTMTVESLNRDLEIAVCKVNMLEESNTKLEGEKAEILKKVEQEHEELSEIKSKTTETIKALTDEKDSLQEDIFQLQNGRQLDTLKYLSKPENVEWENKWNEFCIEEKRKRRDLYREMHTLQKKLKTAEEDSKNAYDLALMDTEMQTCKEEMYRKLYDENDVLSDNLDKMKEHSKQLQDTVDSLQKQPDKPSANTKTELDTMADDHPCKYKVEYLCANENLQQAVKEHTVKISQYEETIEMYEARIKRLKNEIRRVQNLNTTFDGNLIPPALKDEPTPTQPTSTQSVMKDTPMNFGNSSSSGGIVDHFNVVLLEAKIKRLEQELDKTKKLGSKDVDTDKVKMRAEVATLNAKLDRIEKENVSLKEEMKTKRDESLTTDSSRNPLEDLFQPRPKPVPVSGSPTKAAGASEKKLSRRQKMAVEDEENGCKTS